MLGGGGVEAVIELHRAPDAQVTIALEDCLHALPAIHLTGFLVIHCSSQGRGTGVMWGLVSRPVFGAMGGGGGHTSGVWPAVRNISKCLYCGIGRCDWPMGGGGHRRI